MLEPTASLLLIKARGEDRTGNVSLEDVFQIARVLRPKSLAATYQGTVKEILGTAKSIIGLTVNGQDPLEVTRAVESGAIVVPKE